MDKNEWKGAHNPGEGINPLSAITFSWLLKTFLRGFKRELEVSDLYSPLKEHSSNFLGNKLSKLWKKEVEKCQKLNVKQKPSLLKVLTKCFGFKTMIFGLWLGLFEFVVRTTQPIILANLLRYFSGIYHMERLEAFYWGSGIVIGLLLEVFICSLAFQGLTHMGMKIRVGCCSLIYRKILKVSKSAIDDQTSVGQMVNLFSNDVNRLDYSMYFLHYIWIAPIQTAIISYLLYREVNLAAVGGIITLLLFISVHGCYGKLASHLTSKMAYRTDERLRLTNEIISAVKVIKMYAWEKPFSYLMDKARAKEVKVIRNNLMAFEMTWSFETYIPRVCVFITVLAYILFGHDIDAGKVYLITAYYNVLRTTLYRYFALSIKQIAEASVSVKRLQKFLLLEEIDYKSVSNNSDVNSQPFDEIALLFKNVTAKWQPKSKTEALKQITFQIQTNSLTSIVGQVGAGKTTLFHAILNEIPITHGKIKVNGKISYSSQEAWLFASTIKQNILFGQPFNKERYEQVVDVCQLKRDFQLFPYGDNTLVGEKGINLSGGQCARVNLARAVYHEADIYLLDDPLSAVDAHVGRGIFEDCIKTFLKNKTVILVTHQFHFLKHVDRIIILANGSIQEEGTYSELLKSGLDITKMIKVESGSDEICDNVEVPAQGSATIIESMVSSEEEDEHEESRTVGSVSSKIYLKYFSAARNGFLVCLVFLVCIVSQMCSTGADYFITYWVNIEETDRNFTANTANDDPFRGRSWYIYVYGAITISTIFITLLLDFTFFNMSMKISRNLHALMFDSIIHTTMAFYNANPIGRIMNRFSKDTGIVDTLVPQAVVDVTVSTTYTIAVIILVSNVSLWFLIPAFIIGVIAYFFRMFYIRTSRSVKRLEGITRSPVFNHLSASVRGLTTIRALNAQSILTKEFDNHQNLHSSAWFIFFSGAKAFGMYLELMCSIFIAVVTYTLLSINDVALAGDVGLIITQCMLLTGILQWGIRQTTELENYMTSVERILEFSKLPQEPALDNAENAAPNEWPQKGQIIFKNVNLTYDNQDKPALKNLNFIVEPNEKIGIVGRTGAGKSSIINALFRLADLEGEIYIDNLETSKIALKQLRSKISIIPQEPVLFAGTLRRNLDPFNEYLDTDLWLALEDVELKRMLDSDLGLNMKIMEGGTNFSVGQRQLLCMARAIVRNNKVLVLDEATANVDPKTDELIQKTMRRKFKNCTVFIIAHRLNTVMDCSKILVMDAGQVMEFDHAYKLLQQKDGVFFSMVQQTGASTAENLFEIAKSSYESKNTE